MKFKKFGAIAALCAAMAAPAVHAASSSAWASIYNITFEAASLEDGYTAGFWFGPDSAEATAVQAVSSGTIENEGPTFVTGTSLYSILSTLASITEGPGYSTASASTGANYMSASGSTNISNSDPLGFRGTYSATASLNQEYYGASTFGGWFTLAPMTEISMSGMYDLMGSINGDLCGPFECSAAFASVNFSLGDQLGGEFVHVYGESGPTFTQITQQEFDLTFRNDSYGFIDVFFSTSVAANGFVAAGLVTGAVPEPDAHVLMVLGLGIAGWLAWRRQRPGKSEPQLQLAAA